MLDETYLNRFAALNHLYTDQLQVIAQSCFVVIGVGGVGSWAAEALARSGAGHVVLMDLDDICVRNINRQLPALTSTLGQFKTHVLKERLLDINPQIKVHIEEDFLDLTNIKAYLQSWTQTFGKIQVIDAIDNSQVKAALAYECLVANIPLIISGSAGGKIQLDKILLKDLAHSSYDPVLASVRRRLKKNFKCQLNRKKEFGVKCVFSTEELKKNPNYNLNENSVCDSLYGSFMPVTCTFGMYLAQWAILSALS